MVATQGTSLPYDLQGQIIGHLQEDPKSLAACSLVSCLWSDLARMLLFSRLQAQIAYNGDPENKERIVELIALLEAPNSRLGQYINRVSIDGTSHWGYDMLFPTVLRIVPRLPRVHTLEIKGLTWCSVPHDAQIQIGTMSEVRSLSWSRIYANRMDDLLHFSLENFLKLEEFQISEVVVEEVSAFVPTRFSPHADRFMSLRKLVILIEDSTVSLVLALTNNIISVQNIDTLDVEIRRMAFFGYVDSLLKAIGPTLTALKIWLNLDYRNFKESLDFPMHIAPFSLGANVNLRVLSLVSDCYPSDLMYWKQILLSNTDIRERIEIRLKFSLGSSEEDYLNTYINFSVLEDALLVQKPHSVRVVLECYTVDAPGLSDAIIRSTRELAKRVQMSVESECWDAKNPFDPSSLPPVVLRTS